MIDLRCGDCLAVLPALEANSVDSIVTDPPYGLSFMGKDWDHGVPGVHFWREALRVAKPGAHLLAFGGTRTFHRLAVAIEDAGWEIRDTIMWVYGGGFPKSLDVSKAIDKAAGAERDVVGKYIHPATGKPHCDFRTDNERSAYGDFSMCDDTRNISAPATPDAARWQGWGTALKPAWEPIIVARKPLEGTVAANVLRWGTGAINVDGCRVAITDGATMARNNGDSLSWGGTYGKGANTAALHGEPSGRFPANLIHDGSDEVVGLFPVTTSGKPNGAKRNVYADGMEYSGNGYSDTGSAARFFYCAKASRADRDEGLDGLPEVECGMMEDDAYPILTGSGNLRETKRRNHHPTVKPTALMRYLVRLVTPPGGVVLDPFMGSGSTGKAAMLEGFSFVGIEMDAEYVAIAQARVAAAQLPLLEAT